MVNQRQASLAGKTGNGSATPSVLTTTRGAVVTCVLLLLTVIVTITNVSGSFRAQHGVSVVVASEPEERPVPETQPRSSDWPGVPSNELGAPLLRIGNSLVNDARTLLLENLDKFLEVYAHRPDKTNTCGIRFNHAMAIYFTVKELQPKTIIESGINSGQSTYFMRAAANATQVARASSATSNTYMKILSFDPEKTPICGQPVRWIDKTNNEYFVGDTFQDFNEFDWAKQIRAGMDPRETLVFIDDHLNFFVRMPTILRFGFQHILLEDNYEHREGATPGDKAGFTAKQLFAKTDADATWFHKNLVKYAEFPPLISNKLNIHFDKKKAGGFLHPTDDQRFIEEPILRPENSVDDQKVYEKIAKSLGIDSSLKESQSYQEMMGYNHICYFEMVPFSPFVSGKIHW